MLNYNYMSASYSHICWHKTLRKPHLLMFLFFYLVTFKMSYLFCFFLLCLFHLKINTLRKKQSSKDYANSL